MINVVVIGNDIPKEGVEIRDNEGEVTVTIKKKQPKEKVIEEKKEFKFSDIPDGARIIVRYSALGLCEYIYDKRCNEVISLPDGLRESANIFTEDLKVDDNTGSYIEKVYGVTGKGLKLLWECDKSWGCKND